MARALNLLPSFPNTSKICLLFTLQLDLSIRHIHLDGYIRHTTNSPGQDQKHLKLEPISEVKNKNNFWTRGLLQFINSKCNHFCRMRVYNNQIHIRSVPRRIRTTSLALAKRLKYACIMNPASPCICKSVIELCARFGIAIAHAVTGSFNLVNLYRHLYIYWNYSEQTTGRTRKIMRAPEYRKFHFIALVWFCSVVHLPLLPSSSHGHILQRHS